MRATARTPQHDQPRPRSGTRVQRISPSVLEVLIESSTQHVEHPSTARYTAAHVCDAFTPQIRREVVMHISATKQASEALNTAAGPA